MDAQTFAIVFQYLPYAIGITVLVFVARAIRTIISGGRK